MTFQSTAQQLYVIDPHSPASPASMLPAHDEHSVSAMPPHFEHEGDEELISMSPIEVSEPVDVEIVVEELPGAPAGTKDPEIEVHDESLQVSDQEAAKDEKKDPKAVKNEKWDWSKHGPHGFVAWIKERLGSVPKHSGYDSAGLERAMAYMEKLDSEISKAMRMDLDEELDANKIEQVRSELDEGLSRLQVRLDKVKDSKKSSKKRKKAADYEMDDEGFVKEAQKIIGVSGVYITVPLLISRIARVCINGTVSAGHDIEDLYNRQVKKWNLTEREQAETMQLLFDMGDPLRQDRGFMPDDDLEVSDSDNMDWAANYRA
jgi:hypothetical protein